MRSRRPGEVRWWWFCGVVLLVAARKLVTWMRRSTGDKWALDWKKGTGIQIKMITCITLCASHTWGWKADKLANTGNLLGDDDEAISQHPASDLIEGTAVNTCLFLSPGNCWCCSPAQIRDCSRVISTYNSLFAVPYRWPTEDPKLDERFLHPWRISEGSHRSQTLAWKEN